MESQIKIYQIDIPVLITEFEDLAKWYSRKNGKILIRKELPYKPFIIDDIQTWSHKKKQSFLKQLRNFVGNSINLEDLQLYDNLIGGETDFAYPTQLDVDFLKSLGYDSVYYSIEGNQEVNSWFPFDD